MSEPIKRTESRFNESWPIGLLQACPRCGNETHNYLTQNESLWFDDFTAGCYRCNHSENRERWNLRPVEHKLEQQITQLTKERDEEKKWSEELAKACCEMEDALGFKQDQVDEHGAMIPTFGPWKERVRDLIAKEGELGDLKIERDQLAAKCASYKHVIQLAWEDRRDDSDAEYVGKLAEAKCNDQCGVDYIKNSEWRAIRDQNKELAAKCAEMREELENLMGQACEFIGPDEDGQPECVCCGMCLDEKLKGHKSDCLADAIQNTSHALSDQCGVGWLSPEKKKVLVGLIQRCDDYLAGASGFLPTRTEFKQALDECKEQSR